MTTETPSGVIPYPLIYGRMSDILKDVDAIAKSSKNQAQGFSFRGIDAVMNELHGIFAKHRVFITSTIIQADHKQITTGNGKATVCSIIDYQYTFWADDGSCVSTQIRGEGFDYGDKASNKAASIALKYALLQAFLIPTEEEKDPDGKSYTVDSQKQPSKAANGQPTHSGNGQAAASPAEEDQRPWLSEKAFITARKRIADGEPEVFEKTKAAFRMKKEYRQELEEFYNQVTK